MIDAEADLKEDESRDEGRCWCRFGEREEAVLIDVCTIAVDIHSQVGLLIFFRQSSGDRSVHISKLIE